MGKKRTMLYFAVAAGGYAIVLVVLLLLRTNAAIAEFWSTHFAAAYTAIVGRVTSLFSFSFFELFIVWAVVAGISTVALGIRTLIKKRRAAFLTGLLALVIFLLQVLTLYTATMGFAYYRRPLSLPQSDASPTEQEVLHAAAYFRDDFFALSSTLARDAKGNVVRPYSVKEMSRKIAEAYERAAIPGLYDYTPRAKPIANSWLLSWLHLTGITFLPTAEPNFNAVMPLSDAPHTIAHEMAHAKGIAREGDANLVAYYVLLLSDDPYLRYCGYFACYGQVPNAVFLATQDEQLTKAYGWPQEALAEYRNVSDYWSAQPDIIGSISSFFNNLYLKLNGADNGTGSYGDGTGSGLIDTGETDGDGRPIYKPSYSTLQRVLFNLYEARS